MFIKLITATVGATFLAANAAFSSQPTMLASWYGSYFHQRTTANGEIFDMYNPNTAAHKSLPFGTKLRVCLDGCIVVRINDRGPYVGERELDLSYAGAKAIGMLDKGVANVTIEYL